MADDKNNNRDDSQEAAAENASRRVHAAMSGLVCPRCGCKDFRDDQGRPWNTIKTVPIPGAIRRYKICRYCGRRVRTRETLEK